MASDALEAHWAVQDTGAGWFDESTRLARAERRSRNRLSGVPGHSVYCTDALPGAVAVVTGVSLNSTARINFPPQQPSLVWYANFFADAGWMSAFTLSLIIAALIDAARTRGARDSEVLRTVIRPIVLPYALSGLVFVFILSLNEYIIAYMVAGFEVETLPNKVFNNLRMGFTPTRCVGAVLFMLLGILGFSLIALLGDLPKLLGARSR
jgi:ABC-type spermidine/putrescine transport system permease subunit II